MCSYRITTFYGSVCREVAPVTVSTRQTDTHPGLGRVGRIIRTARRPYSGDNVQNFCWPLGIFFFPAIPKRRGFPTRPRGVRKLVFRNTQPAPAPRVEQHKPVPPYLKSLRNYSKLTFAVNPNSPAKTDQLRPKKNAWRTF